MKMKVPILNRLRAETRASHASVDALPFFAALHAGTLPRAVYITFLEAMTTIHETMEQAVATAVDPVLAVCWVDELQRLPLLQRDLDHFQAERTRTLSMPRLHAIMLAEQIALRERRDPASLVGYLYVLVGSALGGLVLRPQVARTFGLEGTGGLAYLTGNAQQTRGLWTTFTTTMNTTIQDPALQLRVVAAALEAFDGIEQLILALYPRTLKAVAAFGSTLNPEAGTHGITTDPREIRAALRAGVRSWERFPYYEWRYGLRGRRFTRSDSAWLVTLAALPQDMVDRKIAWLGQVLAARGMPRWLLELHLEVLHEELNHAVPEHRDGYLRLLAAAHHLRQQRTAVVGEEAWQALETAFDAAVGAKWARQLPGCGGLLVAAVCDEAAGVHNAVASLAEWMTDPTRFPKYWVAAVRQTLAEARRLAQPG